MYELNESLFLSLLSYQVYISEEAGHLLQWMLSPNPEDRPTLSQVMLHEWVVDGAIEPPTSHNF